MLKVADLADETIMRRTKAIVEIFVDAFYRLAEDDGWAIASHIALTTLTSLFPFLIFVTAIAGFIGTADLAQGAAQLVFDVWPRQVAAPIAAEIHAVLTTPHGGLLTIGGLLTVYFSSSGVEAFRIGLNRAYGVRERRVWWLLRLESIAYVLVGALALLALAFLVVLAPLIWTAARAIAPELDEIAGLLTLARYGLASLILIVALVIAHKWLPADHRTLLQIAPGITLTVLLSLVFSVAFGAYLAQFARNYTSTYGGLASFMIALVFLYSLAGIFVYGGELNAAIIRRRKAAEAEPRTISNVTLLSTRRSRFPKP
jgi:membrane protein